MTTQIIINVPPGASPEVAEVDRPPAAPAHVEAPPAPTESAADAHADDAWFPTPPDDGAAPEGSAESTATFDDVDGAPPGLDEFHIEPSADAADIGPPDVSFAEFEAVLDDALPPDVDLFGLDDGPVGGDVEPPDPSTFEAAKKPQRRRKAS